MTKLTFLWSYSMAKLDPETENNIAELIQAAAAGNGRQGGATI